MESNESKNGSSVFIDLSTSDLLEEFTEQIPVTSEQISEQPQTTVTPTTTKASSSTITTNVLSIAAKLKCPECNRFSTTDEDKLTRHIRKAHRGENPFQCYMCDYSTYNNCLFNEHVRIHKGIKPFKCAYCPHRNVSKKNLKKHEKIHRPDNPLKCQHCDYIARHKRSFNCHAKNCPPVKLDLDLSCEWCQKVFTDKNSLVDHTSRAKTCNMLNKTCQFKACSIAAMRSHKEMEHGKPKRLVKAPVKKDTFKCSLCEWSSHKYTKILLHLVHHPNQKVDESHFDLSVLRKHGIME